MKVSEMESERSEFLLHMYDQLINDVTRHILIGWQSLTIIGGSALLPARYAPRARPPINTVITVEIARVVAPNSNFRIRVQATS